MDKLLALITKLRNEIVPEGGRASITKMAKGDLLKFITDANLLERMRTFHQKEVKGIRSALTDDEGPLVPSESEIQKWRVGKLRKLVRDFHRSTQIFKKFDKMSAARLRSHIKRNRYEEMMYGDDLPVSDGEEPEKKKKPKTEKPKEAKERVREKHDFRMPNIVINTGDNPPPTDKKKCGECCEDQPNKLADQDFFGLIQKLSPNLYKVLAEKAFLLDICALDRERMESNVCPVDCRPKAWNDFACCGNDAPPPWFIKWYGSRAVPTASAGSGVRIGTGSGVRTGTGTGVGTGTGTTLGTRTGTTVPVPPPQISIPPITKKIPEDEKTKHARTRQVVRHPFDRRPRTPREWPEDEPIIPDDRPEDTESERGRVSGGRDTASVIGKASRSPTPDPGRAKSRSVSPERAKSRESVSPERTKSREPVSPERAKSREAGRRSWADQPIGHTTFIPESSSPVVGHTSPVVSMGSPERPRRTPSPMQLREEKEVEHTLIPTRFAFEPVRRPIPVRTGVTLVTPPQLYERRTRVHYPRVDVREKLKVKEDELEKLRAETKDKIQATKDLAFEERKKVQEQIIRDAQEKAERLKDNWDRERENLVKEVERTREGVDNQMEKYRLRMEVSMQKERALLKRVVTAEQGEKVSALEKDIEALKSKVQEGETGAQMTASEKSAELLAMTKELESLRRESERNLSEQESRLLAEHRATTAQAKAELDTARREIQGLQHTVGEQKTQITVQQSALLESQNKYNTAHLQLAEANAKIFNLDQNASDYDQRLAALVVERNAAYTKADAAKEKLANAKAKSGAELGRIQTLTELLGHARDESADKGDALKALQTQFDQAHTRLAEVDKRIYSLDQDATTYQQEKATLVEERNKAYKQADTARAQLSAVNYQLMAKSTEAAALQERLRSAEASAADARTALSNEQAKSEALRNPAELQRAQGELNRSQQIIADLQGKLGMASGELKGAQAQLSFTKEQLAKEQQQSADMTRTLATLQRDFQEAKSRATAARTNMEVEMQRGQEGDQLKLGQLQQAHQQASQEAARLQGELAKMSNQLGISNERATKLQGELQFVKQQAAQAPQLLGAQAQLQVLALQKDKQLLQARINDLTTAAQKGDQQAKMDLQQQQAKMADIDRRLAAEFTRGVETGRLKGITLGKSQADAALRQQIFEYEGKIVKFQSQLQQKDAAVSVGEASLRDEVKTVRAQYEAARGSKDDLQKQIASSAASEATAKTKLDAAQKFFSQQKQASEDALAAAKDESARHRKLGVTQGAEIKALNQKVQDEITRVSKDNDEKIAKVRGVAKREKNTAVQRAVDAAEMRHKMTVSRLDSQIKTKDAEIAHHRNHAQQTNQKFEHLSRQEVKKANVHADQLLAAQKQIENARVAAIGQLQQMEQLKQQLRDAQSAGQMEKQEFASSMRKVTDQSAKQNEHIAQLDKANQDLTQQAAIREVGDAENQRRLHTESARKVSALRDKMNQAARDKHALLEKRHAEDMRQSAQIGEMHSQMHAMYYHMQQNPGDSTVLNQMRSQVREIKDEDLQGLLADAEQIHAKHNARPAPFVVLQMPDEEKTAPLPPQVPDALKRARSPSVVEAPAARELRAKRGRLVSRLEDAMAAVRDTVRKQMQEERETQKPPHVVIINDAEPTVVQNLLKEFNSNPTMNVEQAASRTITMDVHTEDRNRANIVVNTIKKVQEGLREGANEAKEKLADLDQQPPDQTKRYFNDLELEAYCNKVDAMKRAEMLKFQSEGMTAQTKADLEANIAKDNARYSTERRDLSKNREKYGFTGYEKSGPISIPADEEEKYRAAFFEREAKFAQDAVAVAKQVVEEVAVEPVIGAQIVSERLDKVKKAAKRDRQRAPNLTKEEIGPETAKIVNKKGTINFRKAMEFVQKEWWKVDPHFLRSGELQEIEQASAEQGLTINGMVKNQSARVNRKMKTVLKGRGLKKYSLTTNSPDNVQQAVQQTPFSSLHVKQLNAIVDSYLGIINDATPVEKGTPVFRIAGVFIPMIEKEISNQEAQTAAPSRLAQVSGRRQEVHRERVRVDGRGLPKKPRKRSKPRKKRVKTPKKSPKPTKKEKKQVSTGLQKWQSHKKSTKRMRL